MYDLRGNRMTVETSIPPLHEGEINYAYYVWGPDRLLQKRDTATGDWYYYLYNGHDDVVQIGAVYWGDAVRNFVVDGVLMYAGPGTGVASAASYGVKNSKGILVAAKSSGENLVQIVKGWFGAGTIKGFSSV